MILDPARAKNIQGIVDVNVSEQSLEFVAEGEYVGGGEDHFVETSSGTG